MRHRVFILCILLSGGACSDDSSNAPVPGGGDEPDPVIVRLDSYAGFKSDLEALAALPDATQRVRALATVWDTLRADGRFPFVHEDSVMFLYRGEAGSATFTGDFSGWSPTPANAVRLGSSDAWIQEDTFPLDARLDYKIVLNGNQWLLDPENPLLQRGGFGDNSELRMSGYVPSPHVVRDPAAARGEVAPGSLNSARLGYTVNFQVYTPAGYAGLDDLPVMYVTDGHEYADPLMGSMVEVLDNLIHQGLLRPVMAVFVDPRVNGSNLRADQYILNPDFAFCVAHELVPLIDSTHRTLADRDARGILGTSLGGLNSAYFGVRETDTWGLVACQSPAFQAGDGGIVALYEAEDMLPLDMFLTWGTFHDTSDVTFQFRDLLDSKGYDYRHVLVNEGHSWGNWRALLDDILLHYWAVE